MNVGSFRAVNRASASLLALLGVIKMCVCMGIAEWGDDCAA